MLTVNGAMYKDVSHADFAHYFSNTAMAWKISPTKRRLFMVGGTDGLTIVGTYLTREKELKSKELKFKEWWTSLDPVVTQPLMFNLPGGAACWKHQFNKNLKKSFPWITNAIKFYGSISAADKGLQSVCYSAFQELYGVKPILRPLIEVLQDKLPAEVTSDQFLVDREGKRLLFKSVFVGSIEGGTLIIHETKKGVLPLLKSLRIPAEKIQLVAPPKEPSVRIPMKANTKWVAGYQPVDHPIGYSVIKYVDGPGQHPEFRTYPGLFPGNHWLSPGWTVHNIWGQ
jgi:hypothetical protein